MAASFEFDSMTITVPEQPLKNLLEQVASFSQMAFSNEYEFSSLFCRHLDRYFFGDEHVHEGAVLSQLPLESTRRCDIAIVLFDKWSIKNPVVAASDVKQHQKQMIIAERESQLYSMCALSKSAADVKFPFFFSFPACTMSIKLEMHRIVNSKLQYISIFEAKFDNKKDLKKFFMLTYGLIRWTYENNDQRLSSVPLGIVPVKDLELCHSFENHENVFCESNTVYKFYDGGHKHHNVELMQCLDYMKSAKITPLSKDVIMLTYDLIPGKMEPQRVEQFLALGRILEQLHGKNKVHGDVRAGNMVFGNDKEAAFLIDFDFTSDRGDMYHADYNHTLAERHPSAKPGHMKHFDHDWYSLIYLLRFYFKDVTPVKESFLNEHINKFNSGHYAI